MTSAPRSASTCVPKGPAPNCDTARMRTPSSGGRLMSVGEPALAEGRVVLLGDEDLASVGAYLVTALIRRMRFHGDDAAVALARLPQRHDTRVRVEGVADERGLLV